jgi:hypothetical protein
VMRERRELSPTRAAYAGPRIESAFAMSLSG